MLEHILQEATEHIESRFYSEKFNFSYSSISKLMFSPTLFYRIYILKDRTEKTQKNLVEGKVIHALLLEPDSFTRDYIVSPTSLPTGKVKDLIDTVYYKNESADMTLEECEYDVLSSMISMNYYQALKKDEDRLKKVITAETRSYWQFLKEKGTKTLIDEETYVYCQEAVQVLNDTPGIRELLGTDGRTDVDVYNELRMEVDLPGKVYGLQGILDNLVIDHKEKTITINDFKTSGKGLKDFKDTIEHFDYWMQCVIYLYMVENNYKELIAEGYDLKFNFIVIDKYHNVYPFAVTRDTLMKWFGRFRDTLGIVSYHYDGNRYKLPHAFDTGAILL